MANKKLKGAKLSKKIARQLVYDKLALALSDLKPATKNKKFESRLRQTSKVFANYIIKDAEKDNNKAKAKTKKEEKQPEESPVS